MNWLQNASQTSDSIFTLYFYVRYREFPNLVGIRMNLIQLCISITYSDKLTTVMKVSHI